MPVRRIFADGEVPHADAAGFGAAALLRPPREHRRNALSNRKSSSARPG